MKIAFKNILSFFLALLLSLQTNAQTNSNYSALVNPFIGTGGHGHELEVGGGGRHSYGGDQDRWNAVGLGVELLQSAGGSDHDPGSTVQEKHGRLQ